MLSEDIVTVSERATNDNVIGSTTAAFGTAGTLTAEHDSAFKRLRMNYLYLDGHVVWGQSTNSTMFPGNPGGTAPCP